MACGRSQSISSHSPCQLHPLVCMPSDGVTPTRRISPARGSLVEASCVSPLTRRRMNRALGCILIVCSSLASLRFESSIFNSGPYVDAIVELLESRYSDQHSV